MVKCGFVADEDLLDVTVDNYEQYILRAGRIKKEIVEQDFRDRNKRQVLNFGHTIGHALEAYFLKTEMPLTHGEAVALGMWCALWISVQQCGLREEVLSDYELVKKALLSQVLLPFETIDIDVVMDLLAHDKKRHDGEIRFVLLKAVEKPLVDQRVDAALVRESLVEMLKSLND
jgi:3-dehydroquinate synthase